MNNHLHLGYFKEGLASIDPEVHQALIEEEQRQQEAARAKEKENAPVLKVVRKLQNDELQSRLRQQLIEKELRDAEEERLALR